MIYTSTMRASRRADPVRGGRERGGGRRHARSINHVVVSSTLMPRDLRPGAKSFGRAFVARRFPATRFFRGETSVGLPLRLGASHLTGKMQPSVKALKSWMTAWQTGIDRVRGPISD